MKKKVVVIGSGFAGLSAACFLGREGYDVIVIEKNSQAGGRAQTFQTDGFLFDMGPSWYWMPDVFEKFYNQFSKTTSDFYELKRLNPSYQIFFNDGENAALPADPQKLSEFFESHEKGGAIKLKEFLTDAEFKYRVGMNDLIYEPGNSFLELMKWVVIKNAFKLNLFKPTDKFVRTFFSNPKLIQILEFPGLFLGERSKKIPALYSLMNYADLVLGTWYPMGGMSKITDAMVQIAKSNGVHFVFNESVNSVEINGKKITQVVTNNSSYSCDAIVAGADYHHVEQKILPAEYRMYDEHYWNNRSMAPSSLIFYLGINKKIKNLLHHNLFFDADFENHAKEIYENPAWPTNPLFYVCCPSKTDEIVAPLNQENLFILIPVAAGLDDNKELHEIYFKNIIERIEAKTGEKISGHIIYKRSYSHRNFVEDYNAFKGNAYGLASTLMQTAFLRPKIRSKKLSNLFYAGQLTVPGPGVPPAIISGEISAKQLIKYFNQN